MPLRYFCCFLGPRIQLEKRTREQLEQDYRANLVTLPTQYDKGKQRVAKLVTNGFNLELLAEISR
jgi:hypothetical protein